MAQSELEKAIQEASSAFAAQIVNAVKGATLEELISLQGESVRKKPGPKPGSKRKKPGPKPGSIRKKPGPKPGSTRKKPGPKPGAKKAVAAPVKKKRVVKNYPKCAYPGCGKNRFVRGKGYCGDHWRQWKARKIKAASSFKK